MDDLTAYCGVACSGCGDYLNNRCPGCRLTEWSADDMCMPVKCCRERGIEYCAFCSGFPCGDMAGFYGESEGHGEAYRRMLALSAEAKG